MGLLDTTSLSWNTKLLPMFSSIAYDYEHEISFFSKFSSFTLKQTRPIRVTVELLYNFESYKEFRPNFMFYDYEYKISCF